VKQCGVLLSSLELQTGVFDDFVLCPPE
jgi:hypothetical protein